MKTDKHFGFFAVGRIGLIAGILGTFLSGAAALKAWPRKISLPPVHYRAPCANADWLTEEPSAGAWYWLRSPEQEKRVVSTLYNRYCVRCHGVDGRGVWDMPDVPDFTSVRWQAARSDGQRARLILEGRGAVMPAFRGTLTLEEAWAMGRYLRSFVPGSEIPRPDLREPAKPDEKREGPAPSQPKDSARDATLLP